MCPKLLSIGPITFYSFGAMLALAFLAGHYFLSQELRRKKLPPETASTVTAISIFLGVAGSKLFHILENIDEFFYHPVEMILSSGGLTFYGGLLCAIVGNIIYLRTKKIPLLVFFDAAAPALILAYGIGRIGCLLAGDGCYGIPSDGPFAMSFPDGIISTRAAANPGLVHRFMEIFPGAPVPNDIKVHPTPLYEMLYSVGIFALLWQLRLTARPAGWLFFLYLTLQAAGRFFVEIIRLNPPVVFGLSEAQILAVL
ncbi:MAG: prolipoprotein diacylglyceryl transferase, partial [Chlorobiales bacterium]|nr:prolipoprotein diacylglyceryl transferase [Chlorobiales bacterium]